MNNATPLITRERATALAEMAGPAGTRQIPLSPQCVREFSAYVDADLKKLESRFSHLSTPNSRRRACRSLRGR